MNFDFDTCMKCRGELVEITEEQYDYMLNVLPPIWARGCFGVSEPVSHTDTGVTYNWTGKYGGKHYICYGTKAEAEQAFRVGPTDQPEQGNHK